MLPIGQVIADARFQLRATGGVLKYDEASLTDYTTILKNGGQLKHIWVADIAGTPGIAAGLYVVRGFQRLRAAERFGLTKIAAVVRRATEVEALVLGPTWGADIGSKLSSEDRRAQFRRYIKAGGHKAGLPRGQMKTCDDIAHDLVYTKPRTIHNWLRKYFPKIAAQMSKLHPGRPRKEIFEPSPLQLMDWDPPPPLEMSSAEESVKSFQSTIRQAINRLPAELREDWRELLPTTAEKEPA
jgi:hypothetical protein